MKQAALILTAAFLGAPLVLFSQTSPAYLSTSPVVTSSSSAFALDSIGLDPIAEGGGQAAPPIINLASGEGFLSKVGVEAGISPLGIQFQAATSITGHISVRATGNVFNYSDNFNEQGIAATGKLNLSSAGASVDFYPFRGGFRLSPGLLVHNGNKVTAQTNVPAGTSFTLNDQTYYSANPNTVTGATPVVGSGLLGLNKTNPAFTMTVGWGNIAHGKGHWSIPVDVGAAFVGAPSLKVTLAGWACYDEAQTQCSNLSDPSDPIAIAIQSNLTTQVAKWTNDLNPLKTYPIASVGLAYSFHIR